MAARLRKNGTAPFRTVSSFLLLLLSFILFLSPTNAEQTNWIDVGFRRSVHASEERESLEQYDLFGSLALPWEWELPWDLMASTKLDLSAGVLRCTGEAGLVASVGPSLVLGRPGGRISLDVGSSAALLSRDEFDEQDFGTHLQFISHASVRLNVCANVGVGYRYQHMSNATLSSQNPGLDLHMLELIVSF